jgi:AraC family transcriptional regulator
MPVPAHTSADWLDRYAAGVRIASGKGPAWQGVRLAVMALPAKTEPFIMPAVTEPFIAWISSGEAEAEEREGEGPWLKTQLKRGSLYLTAGGASYEFRFRTLTPEPFEVVLVLLSLPLFQEGLLEVFGKNAANARLREISGFEDAALTGLLQQLKDEAVRKSASGLFVRGIAQAVAVHLARNYALLDSTMQGESPALPGYKLRRITEWMAEHLADEFSLPRLAGMAGLSEFHFNRLWNSAVPLSDQASNRGCAASAARNKQERHHCCERGRVLESEPLRPGLSERDGTLASRLPTRPLIGVFSLSFTTRT